MSPEQSIELFEMLLFPIQKLIEMDNEMDKELSKYLIKEEENKYVDYITNTKEIRSLQHKVYNYISSLIGNFAKIPENNTEFSFINSYKNTVKIFEQHYSKFYSKIISLIEKEELNDYEKSYFNNNFHKSNDKIDKSISDFYTNAENYAEKYDIEII